MRIVIVIVNMSVIGVDCGRKWIFCDVIVDLDWDLGQLKDSETQHWKVNDDAETESEREGGWVKRRVFLAFCTNETNE